MLSSAVTGYEVPALSTTTPLASLAMFTGAWVKVVNVVTIRILVFSDQNGTLFTEHSRDAGVTISRTSSQPFQANRHEPLSFYPRDSWFRCRVQNTSATAQTFLQLGTIFLDTALPITQSPYAAALGRTSLAAQTRAAIYDFEYDEFANVAPQIKDLHTVQRTSLIADNFRQTIGLDLQTWFKTLTGSGTADIVSGRLQFQTGITANSTARVESIRKARFISGSHQVFRAGVKLPNAGTVNCKRRWGVYDDTSGYFFELDGTTLNAVSRRAGVDTKVAASAWNQISTFVLPSGGSSNRFEIVFFGNTAFFAIAGDNHHQMSGEVGGLPRTNGTNFPNRFEIINEAGNTVDNQLIVTGTSQQRYGPDKISPRGLRIAGAATTLVKGDGGRLHRIIIANGSGANTCTVFDNTVAAGTILAVLSVNKLQGSVEFDLDVSVGITVVTTGGDTDITVVFD